MAVKATFEADFSSFAQAVSTAQVSLQGFEADSQKVSKTLGQMADSFSGRKILEEGAMLNRLFADMDDIALLTQRELREVGATAAEAVEKMNRLGLEVPTNLQHLADTTAKTRTNTEGLQQSLGRFDGILGALGVNIGSEIRALTEMTAAMDSTIAQLGALATAGIAAGAAIGSYGLTRSVLDFLGVSKTLDEAVARNASALLGLGDATKAAAGAQQDVLAKASAIAGHAVTDLNEAMAINEEAVRKHNLAIVTSETVLAEWRDEIGKLVGRGELGQLKEDLDSGVFSMDQLTQRYHMSTDAIELFIADQKRVTDGMHAAEEATRAFQKALDDSAAAAHQIEQEIRLTVDFSIDKIGQRTQAELDYVNASVSGYKQIADVQAANTDFVLKQTLTETDYKILKIHEWEAAQIAAFRGTEQQLAAFTAAVQMRAQQQVDAFAEVANMVTLIGGGSQSLERPDTQSGIHAGPAGGTALTPGFSLPPFSLSTRAGGGPVSAGSAYLVGEHGPEVFIPGLNGSITPDMQRQMDRVVARQLAETNAEIKLLGGTMVATTNAQGVQEIERLRRAALAGVETVDRATRESLAMINETLTLPRAPAIPPSNAGVVVNNYFNVVDTESNIVKRVSDQITRTIKQATKWGAA